MKVDHLFEKFKHTLYQTDLAHEIVKGNLTLQKRSLDDLARLVEQGLMAAYTEGRNDGQAQAYSNVAKAINEDIKDNEMILGWIPNKNEKP